MYERKRLPYWGTMVISSAGPKRAQNRRREPMANTNKPTAEQVKLVADWAKAQASAEEAQQLLEEARAKSGAYAKALYAALSTGPFTRRVAPTRTAPCWASLGRFFHWPRTRRRASLRRR